MGEVSKERKPRLLVFDLDACLWTPEMFQLSGEPQAWDPHRNGVATSRSGELVRLYPGAAAVLRRIARDPALAGMQVAVASKTTEEHYAHRCLDELELGSDGAASGDFAGKKLSELVQHREIYYGSKGRAHFPALKKKTGFAYEDMLFFDDCTYGDNCGEVARCCPGVVCVRTPDGMSEALFDRGLAAFAEGKSGVV
eukprot:TRINITY_DN6123_c0_g1_i1.p1 TRINITY_DN6123_c0_g1~~TRINITY_DN6123_c0_g1_i1.p1  ORF type:complete len:217 (-),score=46.82 TRINITY_DN6123_c0_g1_i1:202-792(-)